MHNLTKDGEFRYIVQWFNEWSELQRDDFVPVLVDYLTAQNPTAAPESGIYMNGLVHAASAATLHDRPMSLFQCRIKLFREWSAKWPQDFKLKLQQKIIEMDTKVGEKIVSELNSNGAHANGVQQQQQQEEEADDSDVCEDATHESAVIRAAQSVVAATEAAIQNDVRLMADRTTTTTTNNSNAMLTPVDEDADVEYSENIVNDNNSLSTTTTTTTATTFATTRAEPAEPVELPTQEHVTTTMPAATAIPI